jgi:hypothetical protein
LSSIYLPEGFDFNFPDGTIYQLAENNKSGVSKSALKKIRIKELAGDENYQDSKMLYYQIILSRSSMSVGVYCQGTREFKCQK